MFSFVEHYIHETTTAPNGAIIILDVADTIFNGWEGAYAVIDRNDFAKAWKKNEDGDFTDEDIEEYGELFCGDSLIWEVVSGNHRKPETAEKNLRKYIRTHFK